MTQNREMADLGDFRVLALFGISRFGVSRETGELLAFWDSPNTLFGPFGQNGRFDPFGGESGSGWTPLKTRVLGSQNTCFGGQNTCFGVHFGTPFSPFGTYSPFWVSVGRSAVEPGGNWDPFGPFCGSGLGPKRGVLGVRKHVFWGSK